MNQTLPGLNSPTRLATNPAIEFGVKMFVLLSLSLLTLDTVYKTIFSITYQTRDKCLLYGELPHWAFAVYENFIELLFVVVLGLFAAAMIERHIGRLGRFVPTNPLTAFAYAAVLPVCSCSAVPMLSGLSGRMPLRTSITFVMAAPLLNPYIVLLSFTVLGWTYAVLRIVTSLLLAVSCGYVAEAVSKGRPLPGMSLPTGGCRAGGCRRQQATVYRACFEALKKLAPYLLIAGALGLAVELLTPARILKDLDLGGNWWGTMLVILIGVPVYFCNGADVLFLSPLVQHAGLPLGTALAFSLTSTSVCITSLVLLVKYLGKRLTLILLGYMMLFTAGVSWIINLIVGS